MSDDFELDTDDHLPFFGCPEVTISEIRGMLTGHQQAHDVDHVITTVLFTDIVDSTRLAGELGNTQWRDLLDAHNATVRHELAVYRGHGYGVFKYLTKYKFTVRSSHTFTATEGKATRIEAVGFERGGVTTPLEDRPAIDFKVSHASGPGGK